MHRSKRVFCFSKQSRNSCKVMPFNASVVFFFTFSTSTKRFPFRSFFIQGNKKKSHGARSGEYCGWRSWVMLFLVKNCFTLKSLCAAALLWWSHHSFHLHFLTQNPLVGTPGLTRQMNKIVNCSVMVFQDQFINSHNVFVRSGGRGSPWARLVCKWQFTIPEAGKTTRKLVFSPVQLPRKLFQALQLFPLPFSLSENRISQPHIVPTFQPSQKSTNKWEALNKKNYYLAPRLHWMMPVGRLMQKGPHKRHLAAEACTTTGLTTREHFRFLLGPSSYI